jgi:hypothetical protein
MIRDLIAKILATSLVGLGASLLPSLSFGLGLGDIQVESHLNQPLYAHIEVVDVSDDDWRLIRARIAPRTLLSEGSVHPEILGSLTLRAVENGKGRHFIEVKSGEALTEPLFDLPVEVAGQSLQVVRNYSVLLDPATVEDAPHENGAAVAGALLAANGAAGVVGEVSAMSGPSEAGTARDARRPAASGAAGDQDAAPGQVDAQAHGATAHRGYRARKHSISSRKLAQAAKTSGASNSLSVPDAPNSSTRGNTTSAMPARQIAAASGASGTGASGQEQLQGQLETLQQTLTKMQATVASQDVEIAKLTAQVTTQSESSASRRPTTWVEYPARKSEAASQDASNGQPGWFSARSTMFYWIGGALAGVVVLALGVVSFLRWRHAKMLREIALNEAARRQPAPRPVEAPTSERDLLTWQTNLRAAQSGSWKQTLEDTFDPTSGAASSATSSASDSMASGSASAASGSAFTHADLESALSGQSPTQSAQSSAIPTSASEDTVATTVALEELTQDLEADLASLNASYEAEYLQTLHEGKDDTDAGFLEKVAI